MENQSKVQPEESADLSPVQKNDGDQRVTFGNTESNKKPDKNIAVTRLQGCFRRVYAKKQAETRLLERSIFSKRVPPHQTPEALSHNRWRKRPSHREAPTLVSSHFKFHQVSDVDTARATVRVRLEVLLMWHDPRLRGFQAHHQLPTALWAPFLLVREAVQGEFDSQVLEFTLDRKADNWGDVYTVTSYGGTISNPMNLRDFPFDYDSIQVTFVANSCRTRDAEINVCFKQDYRLLLQVPPRWQSVKKKYVPPLIRLPTCDPINWKIAFMECNYVGLSRAQDQVAINLWLFRNYTYYVAKVLTPLLMIAIFTLASFWFKVDDLEARLAHCITLLLSTLALLFTIASDIPKLPYSTAFDKLILMTLFFNGQGCVVAVLLIHILDADQMTLTQGNDYYDRTYDDADLALAERVNTVWFWVATITYVVCLVFIFVPKINHRLKKGWELHTKWQTLKSFGAQEVKAHVAGIRRDPSCNTDATVRRASIGKAQKMAAVVSAKRMASSSRLKVTGLSPKPSPGREISPQRSSNLAGAAKNAPTGFRGRMMRRTSTAGDTSVVAVTPNSRSQLAHGSSSFHIDGVNQSECELDTLASSLARQHHHVGPRTSNFVRSTQTRSTPNFNSRPARSSARNQERVVESVVASDA